MCEDHRKTRGNVVNADNPLTAEADPENADVLLVRIPRALLTQGLEAPTGRARKRVRVIVDIGPDKK